MANPHISFGNPQGATIRGRGPPTVRLATASVGATERRRATIARKRASGWIVQTVVVATTSFALLDLYLLLTSSHH